MDHPKDDARPPRGATPPLPGLRRREASDPRNVERKLRADVAAWLKEHRRPRPSSP